MNVIKLISNVADVIQSIYFGLGPLSPPSILLKVAFGEFFVRKVIHCGKVIH